MTDQREFDGDGVDEAEDKRLPRLPEDTVENQRADDIRWRYEELALHDVLDSLYQAGYDVSPGNPERYPARTQAELFPAILLSSQEAAPARTVVEQACRVGISVSALRRASAPAMGQPSPAVRPRVRAARAAPWRCIPTSLPTDGLPLRQSNDSISANQISASTAYPAEFG